MLPTRRRDMEKAGEVQVINGNARFQTCICRIYFTDKPIKNTRHLIAHIVSDPGQNTSGIINFTMHFM